MFVYLFNAFISGLLFYFYLLIENLFWVLAIVVFILISYFDMQEIDSTYLDDKREIL